MNSYRSRKSKAGILALVLALIGLLLFSGSPDQLCGTAGAFRERCGRFGGGSRRADQRGCRRTCAADRSDHRQVSDLDHEAGYL